MWSRARLYTPVRTEAISPPPSPRRASQSPRHAPSQRMQRYEEPQYVQRTQAHDEGFVRGMNFEPGIDTSDNYMVFDRGSRDRDRDIDDDDRDVRARVRLSSGTLGTPSASGASGASGATPPPPPGTAACTTACTTMNALPILQQVANTVPVPSAYQGTLPPATCADACTLLGASGLATAAAAPAQPMCSQAVGAPVSAPGYALDPSLLHDQALAAVSAGLGSAASTKIAAGLQGGMTPAQALAADALVGSLRVRDEAQGWARVQSGQPCLSFPRDHGLHRNMADEWYFVVGVLTARGEGETSDTHISFCWMLDWRLIAPTPPADPLSNYIVDAQFAVAEQGAPNVSAQSAVWGGATQLVAQNRPLLLSAGGMSLQEVPGAALDGLNTLLVKAVNPSRGTLLNLTVTRNPAVAPIALELGGGMTGDLANGNGNLYYSVPFLAVQPGGSVISLNAAGVATARTVTGGLAWFDHQMGTMGRPMTWGTNALWSIVAAAAPRMLPIVDRGFGISGQENWWGLMFTQGPLAGTAFMGTTLSVTPAATLSRAPVSGNWIVPDGKGGAQVRTVSGSVTATASVSTRDGSAFASAFSLSLPAPYTGGAPTLTLSASNLAADGFMTWSKGDTFSEGALVLTCSDGSSGVGWAEQVGWDTHSTNKLLATLNVPSASDASASSVWERAPASFAVGGYLFLVAMALLGLTLLTLMGWGIYVGTSKALAHAHKHGHAPTHTKHAGTSATVLPTTTAAATRHALTIPAVPPAPAAHVAHAASRGAAVAPVKAAPAALFGGNPLFGGPTAVGASISGVNPLGGPISGVNPLGGPISGGSSSAVDSVIARWMQ